MSHVLVRQLLQRTLKQFNATFVMHGKSQINALNNSLRTTITTRWHKERKGNTRSTSTPCLTSKLSKETGQLNQLNRARRSRSFSFHLSPQPSPFLSQPFHGERKAVIAMTKGLLAAADQLPRPHSFPGTACPGPRGNSKPPLPAPNPCKKKGRSCHQARATR